MYPQELATAAQAGANLIVVVVNNGMYGTIRMHREKRYPPRQRHRHRHPGLRADGAGLWRLAERIERTEDFAAAFERARAAGRLALLELITDARQITPAMRLAD